MNAVRRFLRPAARLMLAVYLIAQTALGVVPLAHAGMLGASEVLRATGSDGTGRAELLAALQRDDVQAKLVANGVDPMAAVARVQAMSDDDIARLAANFDSDPAGGAFAELILILFAALAFVHAMGWDDALIGDAEAQPAQ